MWSLAVALKFVRIPRANVDPLHGPHHAAYQTPFEIASCVTEWPDPLSPAIFHVHEEAPQAVSQPLFWLSHTYWPPAIQCVGFAGSASNGATKRGFGSHGLGVYVYEKHDGEISRYAAVFPSDWPPLVVSAMSR